MAAASLNHAHYLNVLSRNEISLVTCSQTTDSRGYMPFKYLSIQNILSTQDLGHAGCTNRAYFQILITVRSTGVLCWIGLPVRVLVY